MDQVITLIAPPATLSAAHLALARDAIAALGGQTAAPDWLAPEEAADIPYAGASPEAVLAALRTALADARVDAIVQAAAGRRKDLLLADMDSTIVTSETLDELAAFAGLKEKIAAITKRAMNGELDFEGALRERVGMLRGLSVSALEKTWQATELMDGAAELVATMRANGARCALVSGGFTFFTSRVAELVGFHEHHSNTLLMDGEMLSGKVGDPILGRDAKLATLKRLAGELGLPLSATMAVGDGANDLAMLEAAGLGVAFKAKPVVAAAARARVDHCGLRALLFAQGYRGEEIRAAMV